MVCNGSAPIWDLTPGPQHLGDGLLKRARSAAGRLDIPAASSRWARFYFAAGFALARIKGPLEKAGVTQLNFPFGLFLPLYMANGGGHTY